MTVMRLRWRSSSSISSELRRASFLAIARRILPKAMYSSWRMRSRVTLNLRPTSSSVSSLRPSRPKRRHDLRLALVERVDHGVQVLVQVLVAKVVVGAGGVLVAHHLAEGR